MKTYFKGLLTAFISVLGPFARADMQLILRDANQEKGLQIDSESPISSEVIEQYSRQRNLVIEFKDERKAYSSIDDSQLSALAEELANILGNGVKVRVVELKNMQLATQAGGFPGEHPN